MIRSFEEGREVRLSLKHARSIALYLAMQLAGDKRNLSELPEIFAEALRSLSEAIADPRIGSPLALVLARMMREERAR